MSLVSLQYTFTPGTDAYSAQVNTNFNDIVTVVNGLLDNTNLNNTGTVGIYASQVVPTTVGQATFGGAIGYTFSPGAAGQVGLTVNGAVAQTADIFDVFLTPAGTKAFSVSAIGTTAISESLSFQPPTATPGGGSVRIYNDGAAVPGLLFNVGASSTNGFTFASNNVRVASISTAGAVSGTSGTFSGALSGTFGTFSGNLIVGNGSGGAGSSGSIQIGGSSTNAYIDFGLTTPGVITFSGNDGSFSFPVKFTGAVAVAGALTGASGAFSSTLSALSLAINGSYGITSAGLIVGSSNGSTTAYVPPVYTPAGAALASTAHMVLGLGYTTSSGGAVSVTLSGAAAFSSSTSYAAFVIGVPAQETWSFNPASGTGFQLTGGSGASGQAVAWLAIGS
jgi:hypothetical protein